MNGIEPDWTSTPTALAAITATPGAIPTTDTVLRVTGPGAVACVQGILTNDIEKLTLPGLVHGAVLTPKGMIITTLWCGRDADGITLIVPAEGREALVTLLARSFPPRLAKVSAAPTGTTVWWLVGGGTSPDGGTMLVPSGLAPFEALWIGESGRTPGGGHPARPVWHAEALRMLGGWPRVGREIDDKTLPQEVRFDELASVAYDKGCYVGQETVARLHFRGHANRTLRAVVGRGAIPAADAVEDGGGKVVAQLASRAVIGDHWLALARVRREVASGDIVHVGGREATIRDLPLTGAMIAGW
ncbi:MAG TPA: hypothetical protein VFN22_11495 [Gemmatimonadales bacterium]|nr:hypothetical protein [Gemmatimonadales bacterium]